MAAKECQKTSNVDLTVMLLNCTRCQHMLTQLKDTEDDPVMMAGIEQLCNTLEYHQSVLTAKINQLDNISDGATAAVTSKSGQQVGKLAEEEEKKSRKGGKREAAEDDQKRSRRLAIEDTIVHKGLLVLDDVAGLQEAKKALKEAIVMPLQFPHLFTGGRKPWKRILLYGPPGTGKSRLAQAIASEIQSCFYSVSSADLISSWVGESEKLIKELFSHATNHDGRSVIFIDEIDSVCRKRSSREEEHTRRIKTELLKQMEGAGGGDSSDKIFLLCATNCPWELDSAFLRRFQKRIYIPLPDKNARMQLMKIHTKDNNLNLSEAAWANLAEKTDGYSGSDLSALVLDALFEPIRDLQTAQCWKMTQNNKYVPCSQDGPGVICAPMTDLPADKVQPREVRLEDFLKSMQNHQNTVSNQELEKFAQFTQNFGQIG